MTSTGVGASEKAAERREYQRVYKSDGLLLKGTVDKYPIKVIDLSLGGCYVETEITVLHGDIVAIELDIPNEGVAVFAGTIAHTDPGKGFGVKFSFMPEVKRTLLLNIIDSLAY
jgi:hypothetical protein